MNEQSSDVPVDLTIQSPAEFEGLLRLLLGLLDSGALKQPGPEGASTGITDLSQLAPNGPWPDVVEAELLDSDGRRYHLFVDTYHGAGGYWRALD